MAEPGKLVIMVRDGLEVSPRPALPAGYSLRRFEEGDEETWVRIEAAADECIAVSRGLFTSQFGENQTELARRQLYAVDEHGEAVGTVTAWFPDAGVVRTFGHLHWLAVVPSKQRQGLGSVLIAAALTRLRELGYERAYLTSSSAREDALRL
jgi:GNAT superfamily N-acetyltransferase